MRLLFPALLGTTLMLAEPAQAQVQAQGQISNFRYTLRDLRPGDGQAAAIRIGEPSEAAVTTRIYGGNNIDRTEGEQGIASLQHSLEWPGNARVTSTYSAGADSFGSGVGLSLDIVPAQLEFLTIDGQAHSPWQSFSVAPHTAVTLSVDVSLTLAMAPESGRWHRRGDLFAAMTLMASPDGLWTFDTSDMLRAWVGTSDYGAYRLEDSESRTFSLSYENTSDEWTGALVDYWVDAYADAWSDYVPPPPVPEPQAWAMLLAGLGLAAMKKRRAREGGNGVCRKAGADQFLD
jgi:hypothetical protein